MKKTCGIDLRPSVMVGACSPLPVELALAAEANTGLLLACNTIVDKESGGSGVPAKGRLPVLGLVGSVAQEPLATEFRQRLGTARVRIAADRRTSDARAPQLYWHTAGKVRPEEGDHDGVESR